MSMTWSYSASASARHWEYSASAASLPANSSLMKGHRNSTVVASGMQMPEVPPASMAMLHSVMRDSMVMASTVEPWNSMTRSVAPLTPILPMMNRMTSLA